MPQYTLSNRDIAEYTRVLETTLPSFSKKVQNECFTKKVMLAILKKHGRIRYNESGNGKIWVVKYKTRDLNNYTDGQEITASRKNLYKQATMAWKMREMNDVITRKEMLMNRGKNALVKLFRNKFDSLKEDMASRINDTVFEDGHTTATSMNGMRSWYGYTAASTNKRAAGNDTYAGLSTVQGNYGGSSYADSQYGFWSPVLINDTGTWSGTDTWVASADEISTYAIASANANSGEGGGIRYIVTTLVRWHGMKHLIEGSGRYLPKGDKLAAGFDSFSYDGVDVVWSESAPTSYTWGINPKKMALHVLSPGLIDTHVDYDIDIHGWKISSLLVGNYIFDSPRHFFATKDFSS